MRRATTLVLVALGAVLAAPVDASARHGGPIGAVFGVLTSPLRALGGAHRGRISHRHVSARSHARSARISRISRTAPLRATPTQPRSQPSRLSEFGSPVWPGAFEDALGYAVAPDDYAERFWSHGLGDVIGAMPTSAASAFAATAHPSRRHHRHRIARADDGNAGILPERSCADIEPGGAGLTARMLERLQLSEPQRRAFEEFRSAFSQATERVKAACRDDAPTSPVARMQALEDRLTAAQYAELHVRGPLQKFYDSLTDAQKQQFEARAFRSDRREANAGDAVPASPGKVQSCGMRDHPAVDRFMRRIEQDVAPTDSQRQAFEALRGLSLQLDRYLTTSCPQSAADDPVKRLSAAGDRLTDIVYASQSTRQVLGAFMATLSEEQMKKLGGAMR